MYVRKFSLVLLVLAVAAGFFACTSDNTTNPEQGMQLVRSINDQYIIVYNDKATDGPQSFDANAKAISILTSNGISADALIDTYSYVINGFSAKLSLTEAKKLMNDSKIEYIEPDQIFTLPDFKKLSDNKIEKDNIQADETPWGISYIGGPSNTTTFSHLAWVLDTGIDQDNPDLVVDKTLSKSFVKTGIDKDNPDDFHGHGTHVSGTIAAKNDGAGVIGVAPGATVIAVKVLDLNGSGWTTDIISGLDYIYSNGTAGDVVNISLGGSASKSLDNAVKKTAGKGIFIAIAAGNDGRPAKNYSPARVDATNVFTVSAHDNTGKFAYWSNYGNPPVDFSAPGVGIKSCLPGGLYDTWSGTSMATPHVAGILLVNGGTVNFDGYVTGDKDRNPDKKAHL